MKNQDEIENRKRKIAIFESKVATNPEYFGKLMNIDHVLKCVCMI